MRFLSKYGRFGLQIRPQISEPYASGMVRVTQYQVAAIFEPQGLSNEERALAFQSFWFNGSLQEQDEVTTVQPDYRIGVFDTRQAQLANDWTDDVREEVERALLSHADRFGDIIAVPEVRLTPPWPRYDEYAGSPSQLARKLVDEGYDLQAVLDYERQNQDREKVVAAIEAAIEDGYIDEPEREEEL